jgi:hypothetical protein
MARFSLKKMCTPAKLYLAISAIFLFSAIFYKISALTLIIKVIFVGIWTLLLNWLCSKGLGNLAWIIVILPFVFLFLSVFTTMDVANYREGLTPGGDEETSSDPTTTSPNETTSSSAAVTTAPAVTTSPNVTTSSAATTGPAPTTANSIPPECAHIPDEHNRNNCIRHYQSLAAVPPKPSNALDPTQVCYNSEAIGKSSLPRCIEKTKENVTNFPNFFSTELKFDTPKDNFKLPESMEDLGSNEPPGSILRIIRCPSIRIDNNYYSPYVPKDGKCVLNDEIKECKNETNKEDYAFCLSRLLGGGFLSGATSVETVLNR